MDLGPRGLVDRSRKEGGKRIGVQVLPSNGSVDDTVHAGRDVNLKTLLERRNPNLSLGSGEMVDGK